jgi:hypothetical protein
MRENLTRRYTRLADLATATEFGVEVDPSLWRPLTDFATGRAPYAPLQFTRWLEEADDLASRKRFFHWELEFPDVFFDRQGRPLGDDAGFEAVVGNPPYVRQERLAQSKPYFREHYESFHSVADLYLYFYEQGIRLLRKFGRMSYISSGTFARANFAANFRKLLPTMAEIETVIDFGENQPFEGAEMVRPSIVVLSKRKQQATYRSLFISGQVPESLNQALPLESVISDTSALHHPEWIFQSAEVVSA